MFILLTYVTYSEWQYKKYKIQKPNWNQKVFKSNGFIVFVFFSLTPMKWFWRYRKNSYHEYVHIVDLCHLLGITIQKIQNTETKLKSKSFQIQWVYSFCVFFSNPSELLWGYRIIIYHENVHIVYLCHLLGITIQKIQNT